MRWKSDLILLAASFLWGSGFVSQRVAATQMSAFTFNGWRFLIAALVIFAASRLFDARKGPEKALAIPRNQIPWMVLAGTLLFIASGLQQAGLATTTISNASFITGLYVVMVPLVVSLVWRERIPWIVWIAVGISVLGVMLLSLQGTLHFAPGDALELAGAVMWAFQIILVGWLSSRGANALQFSIVQFATCGLLNLALALGLEGSSIFTLGDTWPSVLYSALFPIALGFTFQILGQRHAPPVDASLIMSTEAVFGTIFGYFFLNEMLTLQQIAGCVLIMAAIVLAQLRPADAMEAKENTAASG